jgi:thiamine biosynthesis lipoprotein
MESRAFRAMNTEIVLMAEAEPRVALVALEEARLFIEASEKRFTRFSADSELSELNRSAGRWFRSSAPLFQVMTEAMVLFQRTGGLFDPSILPDLRRAGYDRSMDEIRQAGAGPFQEEKAGATRSSLEAVELDPWTLSIRIPFDMQIDLGGVAKGWIAEQAARVLHEHASACGASAGGDMFLIGYPNGQDFWEVAVEDPRHPEADLAIIRAQEGAIATSSVTKRRWKQAGAERHHLIDPRSGAPAETRWDSVTVLAAHAAEAEAFAKAFLLADERATIRLAQQNPGLTVLAVSGSGELVTLGERKGIADVAA